MYGFYLVETYSPTLDEWGKEWIVTSGTNICPSQLSKEE